MDTKKIETIKNQVLKGHVVTEAEALALSGSADKETLYNCANEIRKHFCGDYFDLCSITNAKSGKCSEDCKWCSQSAHHNSKIEIYDTIEKKVAINQARLNSKKGVKRHSLVTSGRQLDDKQVKHMASILKEIRENCNIDTCASMGLLNLEQLKELKKAGISHYHCNLETAPSFFHKLCTTHTIDEKIASIRWAQEAGLKICSGGIIGMGESEQQRIELALTLRSLKIKSIPINILNPIEGTPMEGSAPLSDEEILTTIALFRFINPDAYLRLAGGRIKIKHIEEKALQTGINASITGDLLTTTGSSTSEDITNFTKAGYQFEKLKND